MSIRWRSPMRAVRPWAAGLALALALPAGAAGRTFYFDEDPPGNRPAGLAWLHAGPPPTISPWSVTRDHRAYSRPGCLLYAGRAPVKDYGLALAEGVSGADGTVGARFQTLPGGGQEVGLVWRCRDAGQFYLAIYDTGNDSVSVFRLMKGRLKLLTSTDAIVTAGIWHEMRVDFRDEEYTVMLDGETVISGRDRRLRGPGLGGLWAAGHTRALFDNLSVEAAAAATAPR